MMNSGMHEGDGKSARRMEAGGERARAVSRLVSVTDGDDGVSPTVAWLVLSGVASSVHFLFLCYDRRQVVCDRSDGRAGVCNGFLGSFGA